MSCWLTCFGCVRASRSGLTVVGVGGGVRCANVVRVSGEVKRTIGTLDIVPVGVEDFSEGKQELQQPGQRE